MAIKKKKNPSKKLGNKSKNKSDKKSYIKARTYGAKQSQVVQEEEVYNKPNFNNQSNGVLTIPKGTKEIENNKYAYRTDITSVNFPKSLTSIGEGAFDSCSQLCCELVLPDEVTSIGSYAFAGCRKMFGDIVLPSKLTTIGNRAFTQCERFSGELKLSAGLTTIGEATFYDCKRLNGNLVLPINLENIGNAAFKNCYDLRNDLVLSAKKISMGHSVFEGCDFKKVVFSGAFPTFVEANEMCNHVEIPKVSRTANWLIGTAVVQGVWEPKQPTVNPNSMTLIKLDEPIILATLSGDVYPVEWPNLLETEGVEHPAANAGATATPAPTTPPDLKALAMKQHTNSLGSDAGQWAMLPHGWDKPVPTLDGAAIVSGLHADTLNLSKPIMVVWQTPEKVEGGKVGKAATASVKAGKARTKRKGKKGKGKKGRRSSRKM